jgi:sensor domain CHASE-containing protein
MENKKTMIIFLLIICVVVILLLMSVHIWPHQLKSGVYKENTFERIIRIITGRIDD